MTAIVSVADDGGSSGRLREAFGIPAPGRPAPLPGRPRRPRSAVGPGLRVPLRDRRPRRPRLRQPGHRRPGRQHRRFHRRPRPRPARLLGAAGRVLPATAGAGRPQGRRGRGGGRRPGPGPGCPRPESRVSLVPADAAAPPDAVAAIAGADQVILGPGLALHQRAGRHRCARHAGRRWPAGPGAGSTSATSARRSPRPPASTPPPTSGALRDHGVDVDMVVHDPSWMPAGTLDMPVDRSRRWWRRRRPADGRRLATRLAAVPVRLAGR